MQLGQAVRFDMADGTIVYGYVAWAEGPGKWDVCEAFAVHRSFSVSGRSFRMRAMHHLISEADLTPTNIDHYGRRSLLLRLARRPTEGNPIAQKPLDGWGATTVCRRH